MFWYEVHISFIVKIAKFMNEAYNRTIVLKPLTLHTNVK